MLREKNTISIKKNGKKTFNGSTKLWSGKVARNLNTSIRTCKYLINLTNEYGHISL